MKTKEIKKVNITERRNLVRSVKETEEFIRNSYDEDRNEFVSLQLNEWGSLDHYIRDAIHASY